MTELQTTPPTDADPAIESPDGRSHSLRLVMFVLAFACGAAVANLYYAQPLLESIARSFSISNGTATTIVTVTQIGYALGLAFLIPLGDMFENRALASRTLIGTAVVLAVAAFSPDVWVFLAAATLVGITSVVAQILVPLAAHLAPEQSRGRYVGQVLGGLLTGIMLARSVSSFAAAWWGWRSIYAISAVLMLLTSVALFRLLPQRRPEHRARYGALLQSTLTLVRDEPVLWRRAVSQALMFGTFTAYWTAIGYELIDHHGLTQSEVAVFALVGAAGAAAAPIAGRIGDRGWGKPGRIAAAVLGTLAMLLAWLGSSQLVLLGLAAVLLDLAVQSNQVLCLRDIYALRPEARARVNSVYMTTTFVGGAIASALTGVISDAWGWTGVSIFGAALPALGVLVWLEAHVRGH